MSSAKVQALMGKVRQTFEQSEESEDTGYDNDASLSYSYDSIDEILEDIRTDIECLMDLDPLLKTPIDDLENDGARPSSLLESQPAQFYASLIHARFPQAKFDLVDKLGKANWDRFKRLEAQRSSLIANDESCLFSEHECTETVADSSKFQDSGLGASVPATTVYAATVASWASTTADGGCPRIPPLSEDAKRGNPFTCDACGRNIRVLETKMWK